MDKHQIRLFKNLPLEISKVYTEVVEAYNARLYTLAAMGIRIVIEGICNTSNIPGKNIKDKITGLEQKVLLEAAHVEVLHELRHLGNEAAHQLFTPSNEQMKRYLKVLETTLDVLYEFGSLQKLMELERQNRSAK